MKKISRALFLLLFMAIGYYVYITYPKLDIINGFSSKSVASHHFLTQRSLKEIESTDNNVPSVNLASNAIDEKRQLATASVYGLKKRTAIYQEGLGAILVPQGKEEIPLNLLKPQRQKQAINKPYPFGTLPPLDALKNNVDTAKLNTALNFAFQPAFKTRSVLVIYKDQLITERYQQGFDKHSLFLGWSMAKSVTSTVLGVLEQQGKISLDQTHLFKAWENDTRNTITLRNMLNMNSGLAWNEDYQTISDVTQMLFLDEDMSTRQISKQFAGKPNETWNYSSGVTNALSQFIRHQFDSQQAYLDFWYTDLIDKIGMHSLLIESDYSGNLVGSSYAWATARDWAKLGLLYLHNGQWNGETIINKAWVDFTRMPTNTSAGKYGGHFWLNAGGRYPDVPRDLYFADGYQGQYVFIIPSKQVVIVRTGLKGGSSFDSNGFLKQVLASLQ